MKSALKLSRNEMLDYETAGSGRHKNLRLWLRLLTCTKLIETRIRLQFERSFSVTLPQFDLMAQLDRSPDGLTMTALSERLMVSNGNVTGIVSRLVVDGLVERQTVKTDRRSFLVLLTPKGRGLFHEMAEKHESWVNQMFGLLAEGDISSLMHLLNQTKKSVRSAMSDEPGTAHRAPKKARALPT